MLLVSHLIFSQIRIIGIEGLGPRSYVGAGNAVTKSIPVDCVAAGNPCRVIKRQTIK